MGDRCSVEVLCHRNDIKRFEDIGFVKVDWGKQSDHLARMFEEQADYGAITDLQVLADKSIFFIGASGAGDEYSARVFACDGNRFASANSLSDSIGSLPVAEIDADGNTDLHTMKTIKRYYTTLKAAKKKLTIT